MLKIIYTFLSHIGIVLFGLLFACFSYAEARAAPENTVMIEADTANGSLDQHVQYYLEQGARLSLADVIAPSIRDQFEAITTSFAHCGYYDKGIWLKIPVRNLSDVAQDRLLILHRSFNVRSLSIQSY